MIELELAEKEPTVELTQLSDKHQRVLDEYVLCWNKTKAYMGVYVDCSYEAAKTSAARLFANANFSAHLQLKLDELHMSAEEAFKLQTDIARADMGDFYDDNLILDFRAARQKGLTKLVKKIRQKTTTYLAKSESEEDREVHEIELELYPADAAQERILKMAGKFPANSRRENAAPPPGTVALAPAALLELVGLIEQQQRRAVDAARAVDATTRSDVGTE
jgi:hypothetical protein